MHGVDLGQVTAQRAARAHLDAANGLQAGGGRHHVGVAGRFARIADGVLQRLRLLPQAVEFIHSADCPSSLALL